MNLFLKLLPCIFITCLFAADDSNYVIEAKGEFGKELKELAQKYAKDKNASVKIYEKESNSTSNEKKSTSLGFINIGVNKNKVYNISKGEKLYNENCKHCHGENGNSRAMGVSKRLSKLSAEDISAAMSAYNSDPTYGGRLKYLMRPMAERMSYNEIGAIIAYLKGNNAFEKVQNKDDDVNAKPTSQGTYLE